MKYHAHVYWQNEDQRRLSLKLRESLNALGCVLGGIMEHPIGPHPLPSYQVNYSSDNADKVEALLSRTNLDILLHEDTGDDMRDHTTGARWLGQVHKLDLEWLAAYVQHK